MEAVALEKGDKRRRLLTKNKRTHQKDGAHKHAILRNKRNRISLFIIKVNKMVNVIDFVVGSSEFNGQSRGCGAQGSFGQNRIHLSLDGTLVRLQLPDNASGFLQDRDNVLKKKKRRKT